MAHKQVVMLKLKHPQAQSRHIQDIDAIVEEKQTLSESPLRGRRCWEFSGGDRNYLKTRVVVD